MGIADVVDKTYLLETYLFGIKSVDDLGNPFPDRLYTSQIAKAIAEVETETGLSLDLRTVVDERHDVLPNDYAAGYIKALRQRPVRSVTRLARVIGTQEIFTYPETWVRIRSAEQGVIQVVPSLDRTIQISSNGYLVVLPGLERAGYNPAALSVDYVAGFDGTTYPYPPDILDAVALLASALFLDTAGDLILGAGIASYNVSQDGQSTSINSTSSATNSGYGARAGEYRRRSREMLSRIRGRYRGIDVGVV